MCTDKIGRVFFRYEKAIYSGNADGCFDNAIVFSIYDSSSKW